MLLLAAPSSATPGPSPAIAHQLPAPLAHSGAATELQPVTDADAAQAPFQIGDFTLGDTDCPSLTGHPDIRY